MIILFIGITIISIFIIKLGPLLGSSGIFMPTYNKMEKVLQENYLLLSNVAQYMGTIKDYEIRWDSISDDKLEFYSYNDNEGISLVETNIDNKELSNNLKTLKEKNFINILKESNYVMFVQWSSLESSAGLIYCCDDIPNLSSKKGIKITTIKNKWYYFEHRQE